jgi:smad nuclear-interacting protein 1
VWASQRRSNASRSGQLPPSLGGSGCKHHTSHITPVQWHKTPQSNHSGSINISSETTAAPTKHTQYQHTSTDTTGCLTGNTRGGGPHTHTHAQAKKPSIRWRFYVFKNGEPQDEPLYIHRQSCYLLGRGC